MNAEIGVSMQISQALIRTPRPLYTDEDLGRDLDNAVYALDASTITIDLRYPSFRGHCFAQLKRQHPNLYPHLRRQATRHQYP